MRKNIDDELMPPAKKLEVAWESLYLAFIKRDIKQVIKTAFWIKALEAEVTIK